MVDEADMEPETARDAVHISYYGRTVVDARKLMKSPRVREIMRKLSKKSSKKVQSDHSSAGR